MLSFLPDSAIYYCVKPNIERAMSDLALKDTIAAAGMIASASGGVADGIKKAKLDAKPGDLIVVCGSLFTVGEAKALFNGKKFVGIRG